MNSIVSGAAIEPIMQRMSSVDHDGSVSSNDESSRDRDDDDDEEEEDPSEKPDEVVDVELAAVSPVTVSPVAVEVASPMVVEEEEEDDEEDVNDEDEEDEQEEEEESSESDRDSQASSVNDVTRSSASSDNNNSGISATTMSAVDQSTDAESVLERSRAEIASLSSAMFGYTPRSIKFDGDDDSQSPTRTSSQVVAGVGVTSTATDASLPTPNARPAAVVVGSVSRMDSVAASSPRRFSPYPRRTTNAVPSATTTRSDIITSVNEILRMYSGGNGSGSASPANVTSSRRTTGVVQQQQQQVRSPPALATSGNSQPRTQQSSSTTSSSSVVTAGTMPRMAIPSGTILSGGARRTSQQQQAPNVPQNHQVIRSAIVGNRTIITTKTPSKFPFSADLQQAGAAILGDRYILLDLCDGTSLYKCIDVKTKEEFVCKVSGVE